MKIQMNSNRYLLFDISNIAYRSFFATPNEKLETLVGLAMHITLNTLNKYYKQFQPTKVFMAFDRVSWRKYYTKSDKCVSGQIYKGDRNKNLTQAQQEKLDKFREYLKDFETLMTEHTSVICLAADMLEADDIIAGLVRKYKHDAELTIISRDSDYMQLLTHENVSLYNPFTDKYMDLSEYNDDVNWHLFFKAIRGGEDGIMSAFPRVRKTRLEKAYKDEFEMTNLLNTEWKHPLKDKTFRVNDVYEENRLLMDLDMQPTIIKEKIDNLINTVVINPGKFSHFHFLGFCGKMDLKKVRKDLDYYIPLLSS